MRVLRSVQNNYRGAAVFSAVEGLRQAFILATDSQDWKKIQHLDKICIAFVDRVIAANPDNPQLPIAVLDELKRIYNVLIFDCQQKAASMAV
ncbi:hypothetical protein [Cellvibrio polysaccharolyticus]|uniref:Uncharacterized protein n=1 Tax=Cellvibrio polysaccharolyticus TaxID=2082724 RepID=A0A928YVS2_9GAMM|nr:hypothetical protein [Cellvibrio polysaccharolyticus]MBE8717388.1 hypothetical protein [Cellvibrio polysaccharolyticus]